jgi:hypothetical protein
MSKKESESQRSKGLIEACRRKVHRRGNGLLLTAEEVATCLGEEPRTIHTLRKKGILPFYELGYRCKRFKLSDCLEALEKRKIKSR